ncbi:MAG: ferrochelatase [Bdellovibrionales bacterium]|nr:ferrochelatase [Bdellovibrionales bacterium]
MQKEKTGVLLLNLGTPESPSKKDVRAYLKEFLNDPFVIDIPAIPRKLLVNGIILNTRPKKSAEAYEKIWTERGSPLMIHTRELTDKVRSRLNRDGVGPSVKMAMRYGRPSLPEVLQEFKKEGVESLVFLPLYPQYSYAASESSIVEFDRVMKKELPRARVRVIEDFFSAPGFISALAATLRPVLEVEKPDALLLSYHGVPERQLLKIKKRPNPCCSPGCCERWNEGNEKCYRAQSFETSRRLSDALSWSREKTITAFQSRLGRTKWIEPYTDILLEELPKKGVKKLVVASPSFTADCLETLEEIQLRYRELFLDAGGESFVYVPCLNSRDDFADAIAEWVKV